MYIRVWYICLIIMLSLLLGTAQIGYGQERTYLTGQKTGNKVAPPGISLGTGSAGLTAPMVEHTSGIFNTFRFYKGPQGILNDMSDRTTVRASQDLGLLGVLGAGGNAYVQFRVAGNTPNLPANTPVYFTLKDRPAQGGLTLAVGGLLGLVELQNISGRGYVNAGNYSETGNGTENTGTPAGTQTSTISRFLIDKDGFWYLSVIPDALFNSVRLSVQIPQDLRVADVGRWISTDVYNAFTETAGTSCSVDARYTSPGEATGINLNTGALGLGLSELITSPHHAINDDENEYSAYSSGVLSLGVANTVSQTVYFDHVTSVDDGIRVRLGLSNSLIGLGVANLNAVNFVAYNGNSETPVWSGNVYSLAELLGLDLLNLINLGADHKEVNMVFKPGVAFDRVKIEFNAGLVGLGVLGDALRVYNVSLAPAVPEIIESDQPDDLTICEGEEAIFSVHATVPVGTPTYQWQYYNGTTWANVSGSNVTGTTSSELTLSNVPLSYDGRQYRVQVTGGNMACPQIIYSEEANLNVNLMPGKPHVTISEIVN